MYLQNFTFGFGAGALAFDRLWRVINGAPATGPIAERYHVRGFPSVFVLDAKGVIRSRSALDLDRTVDKLLEELTQPASGRGTSHPGSEKDETPGL